jgi:hypothetical protein
MKIFRLIILATLCAPAVLFGYFYVLLFTVLFAAHRWHFDTEYLTLNAVWRPWVTKFWKYSTALSHGVIYHPNSAGSEQTRQHELVHVRQSQDLTLLALTVAIVAAGLTALEAQPWEVFLGIWVSGVLWKLPNFLTAVLRGGHIYRDTEHERSAFAQTDPRYVADGTSWLEDHLSRPRDW